MGAHPRSRGENERVRLRAIRAWGSSPLTRGKHAILESGLIPGRLIPAHAGKTPSGGSSAWRRAAHPRSRGENCSHGLVEPGEFGSSPLTRGKPGRTFRCPTVRGLIPAHAGKTGQVISIVIVSRAHPRSRGENVDFFLDHGFVLGSSPLTRGKLSSLMKPRCDKWLIPAHAGKTALYVRVSRIPRAHPRSRGENVIAKAAAGPEVGSSPLTRGKPHQRSPHRSSRGLIPAHAGKTVLLRTSGAGDRAHPRSRGENRDLGGGDDTSHGSSPLTRGKQIDKRVTQRFAGLIPAHAGKTLPDLRFYCADRSDLGKP